MTRAQWSHSTEHSGHPVRSTPPERTRHVLAGHLLRSGPTHNHWHATQNSLTILEPVHTRSGLKCCRDGFLPTGTHTGQQLGCCALGPPCLAQARPRPMKGHINFSGSGLNDRVMASEPMTMGWNVQPCPLPLLIFFFFILFFGYAGSSLPCRLFSSCGRRGPLSSCGAQASHCSGLSCCGAEALRLQELQHTGSAAVAASRHVGSS